MWFPIVIPSTYSCPVRGTSHADNLTPVGKGPNAKKRVKCLFPKNDMKTTWCCVATELQSRILRVQRDLSHSGRRTRFQQEGEIGRDEGRNRQTARRGRKKGF